MRYSIISLAFFLTSCQAVYDSTNPYGKGGKEAKLMSKMVGLSKAEVIEAYGAPNRITNDGKDGEIVVFESTQSAIIYGTGASSTFFREFYINNSGKVVRFKFGYR